MSTGAGMGPLGPLHSAEPSDALLVASDRTEACGGGGSGRPQESAASRPGGRCSWRRKCLKVRPVSSRQGTRARPQQQELGDTRVRGVLQAGARGHADGQRRPTAGHPAHRPRTAGAARGQVTLPSRPSRHLLQLLRKLALLSTGLGGTERSPDLSAL